MSSSGRYEDFQAAVSQLAARLNESAENGAKPLPFTRQVGGGHYKDMCIQPVEFIHKNGIGYVEGCIIKYVCRWRQKNGVEDLRKARHYIDLLVAMAEEGSHL